MKSRVLAIATGVSLLIPAWIGLHCGYPTIYCPLPTLTVLPALSLPENSTWLAVLAPVLLFFLWNPGFVTHPKPTLPKRTLALLGVLTILTVADFIFEWRYGVKYHGVHYTVVIYVINGIWLSGIWWISIRCWRRPSFNNNLVSHFLLFAWLGWYAFPYLGELP